MNELVERYIHQFGQYLPRHERAEIEAELRSQIHDALDDRFGDSPASPEVAEVLKEWGHPYQAAASYQEAQYLVGPDLYPAMMLGLRYGWLIVPAIVLFLNVFSVLTSSQSVTLVNVLVEPFFAALVATATYSGLVVIFFAIIQHSGADFPEQVATFNPAELPEVDDPRTVDRFEATGGLVVGTLVLLVFAYWLHVGGLTLRFGLSTPDDVIPVPAFWLALLMGASIGMIGVHLVAMRRKRWDMGTWFIHTILETVGVFGMYFVLYRPIFERIVADNPSLMETPIMASAPEIIAVISGLFILLGRGDRLIKLWNRGNSSW